MQEESVKRSLLKTSTWRILASLDTMVISYFITGNFTMAISIASIEVLTKLALYFFHERAWNKITFGRKKNNKDRKW